MLCMYLVYCVVLHFNPQLERWSQTLPVPCKNIAREEASGLVSYKTLDEEKKRNSYGSPDKSLDMDQGIWWFKILHFALSLKNSSDTRRELMGSLREKNA